MRKKLVTLFALVISLTGCATQLTMKERNSEQIKAVKNVEIVYPMQDYHYVHYDGGEKGTGLGGLGGLFGPLGQIVGAAVDIAASAGTAQQKINRSEKFTNKAIASNKTPSAFNEIVVNNLKTTMEDKGYKVIVSRVDLGKDGDFMDLVSKADKREGYSVLAIRTTSGYHSVGMTKPYHPGYTTRFLLMHEGKQLVEDRVAGETPDVSYDGYDKIMGDFDNAYASLKNLMGPVSNEVYKKLFSFAPNP